MTASSPTSSASCRPRSDEFRQHWARHDVRFHISGVKHFHHREVGDLELNYERLEVVFDTGLTIFTYTADRHAIRRSARPARQLGRHHRRRKADRDAACA